MKQTGDTTPPPSEKPPETPGEQISRLKTEISQALQPIREAIQAGDLNAVKKLYRNLIRTFHEDKFQDGEVKAAMREMNKPVNQIDKALKADVTEERQRIDLLNRALTDIERQTTSGAEASGETGPEVTEGDIEIETALITQELAAIGRECQETYGSMQAAGRKIFELQALQSSLDGLSPEFRAVHQTEIQKINESAAGLQDKFNKLNERFVQTQSQLSFFRYYQQEKQTLAEAPDAMREMARRSEAIKERHAANLAEFDRENQVAETLNRQMEKHQAQHLVLQTERAGVARWQTYLDQQLFSIPPYTQQFNENRSQRQRYDAQDAQLVTQMNSLFVAMQNLNAQQMGNTARRQQLWQERMQLEAQGNQLYQAQARAYENISWRQEALTAARTNISKTVRERKKGRAETGPQAEA